MLVHHVDPFSCNCPFLYIIRMSLIELFDFPSCLLHSRKHLCTALHSSNLLHCIALRCAFLRRLAWLATSGWAAQRLLSDAAKWKSVLSRWRSLQIPIRPCCNQPINQSTDISRYIISCFLLKETMEITEDDSDNTHQSPIYKSRGIHGRPQYSSLPEISETLGNFQIPTSNHP